MTGVGERWRFPTLVVFIGRTVQLEQRNQLAGNTWRARWKYRLFTDMTWLKALWIQAKGVVLEREVRLSVIGIMLAREKIFSQGTLILEMFR